ncbi:Xaa-Pro aminopeptidase [Stackebrandtia albiflava]|uniref:Xaa-Pro aminopeptidase n=1 Tax=Stackebrandtia albiflava TaxID=406432 RepID=A0A562VDV1_9ACTN|nr:Xaa-Pro peptidase family protein [Stackebrandtia albiflava]TWJ15991.1 Xaa-Pro aminopeptidase [Stackebrandtia albiflava]
MNSAAARIESVRSALSHTDIDALVITPGAELRYLTGSAAHPSERLTALVVPRQGAPVLIVPTLERPAAELLGLDSAGVALYDHGDGADAFGAVTALLRERLGRPAALVAVSERMWAAHWHGLTGAAPELRMALAETVLAPMRMVKSEDEVAELAAAAAAIDGVHRRMGEWLRPGRTEAQVARDIAAAIVESGHSEVSFVIVASGPNGASPHHAVSDRIVQAGEPVVVDIGGTLASGYGSDCTRTYSVGEPEPEFTALYRILRHAQQTGVAAVAPGTTAEAVDAATREVIETAGYGEYFTHRTGHGIGLDGHEPPYIVAGDTTVLAPGMTFSIEPGVYVPGRFGARIEDIVVCTETGVRRLNTLSTDLVIL